jgi:hypothetical protein
VLVLTGTASGTAVANLATGLFTFIRPAGNYSVNVSTGEGSPLLPIGSLDFELGGYGHWGLRSAQNRVVGEWHHDDFWRLGDGMGRNFK